MRQEGVLSLRTGTQSPDVLAVLLPGYPSVLRPVVADQRMTSLRLPGNFLVRARRHLADERIALLLVDCRSDSGDTCTAKYQASPERQTDVMALIQAVRQQLPSIQKVWLVSTSMGSISSAFMPMHGKGVYAGAIHTAAITEPYASWRKNSMSRWSPCMGAAVFKAIPAAPSQSMASRAKSAR